MRTFLVTGCGAGALPFCNPAGDPDSLHIPTNAVNAEQLFDVFAALDGIRRLTFVPHGSTFTHNC